MQDGRELFQMLVSGQVMNSQAQQCITNQAGLLHKNNKIVIDDCVEKVSNTWLVDHLQKLRLKADPKWCLTVVSGGVYDNYALLTPVNATSSSDDDLHPPRLAVDNLPTTYWQSGFDEPYTSFTLRLEQPTTITSI